MRFRVLRKYINGILSFGVDINDIHSNKAYENTLDFSERIRKYYENKWNNYFESSNKLNREFVLGKGDWISDSNGVFGIGKGFTNKGEIKCSGNDRKFIINLKGNTIGHGRSDVSYNSRIINILTNSKCKIKNGTLRSENVLDKGAAVCVESNGFLDCNVCIFEDNHTGCSGGAIYGCEFSNIKLTKCKFKNNSASGFGGAIFIGSNSNFESIDSEFINNKARFAQGGAAYFKENSKNICFKGCIFINNKSKYYGEAIFIGEKNNLLCLNCNFEHDGYDKNYDQLVYPYGSANVELCGCKIDNTLVKRKRIYNHLKS